MTKPALMGPDLIASIVSRRVPENALALWWLGQASFAIRGAGLTIYIDPFLNPMPDRLVPPPFAPEDVTNADVVLCSHDHGDHVDPEALPGIAAASAGARFVIPGTAKSRVLALGIAPERTVVPAVDQPVSFGALTVTAVPAAHEDLAYSPETGYHYLGFVLKLNGVTLYHSGDSKVYRGMAERVKAYQPDVALLPINDNDNMSYRQAGDLAAALDVDLVIPMHYGMFAYNTEWVGNFVDYVQERYPAQKQHPMARNEGFLYTKY